MKLLNFSLKKNLLSFIFLLGLLINPKLGQSQSVIGNFEGISAEKINGNFYVFGTGEKYEIKIAKYDKDLKLVREVTRPLKDDIGSFMGIPYVGEFYKRNVFDLRIVYKSGVVAWLTFDLNLNEIGLQEFDYSKGNKNIVSEPNIFNPVYSEESYMSGYGVQKKAVNFYSKNYLYNFLYRNAAEFTNTTNDKYTYYEEKTPIFRKLEKTNNTAPFYKEIQRIDLKEFDYLKNFNPKVYDISMINNANNFIYFLAEKKTGGWSGNAFKDDTKILKVNEQTLQFEEPIELNLDSIIPELGSTFFTKTWYDFINKRIIQIGNYSDVPIQRHWWIGKYELDNPSLKAKGFYVCEFDLNGKVNKFKKFDLPVFDFGPQILAAKKIYDDFRVFGSFKDGVVFSKDGSINIVGENCVLIKESVTSENSTQVIKYYSPASVSFIALDSNFENMAKKDVLKEKVKKDNDLNYKFIEYIPGNSVNEANMLMECPEAPFKMRYQLFSSYFGQKFINAGMGKTVFLYNNTNSIICNYSNKDKKYELILVPNKGEK